MIGLLFAWQIIAGVDRQTLITYGSLPAEIARVHLHEWQGTRLGAPVTVDQLAGTVVIRGTPNRLYVITFTRSDGAYLLDGPFAWPRTDTVRTVPARWHWTLHGRVPDELAADAGVEWIRADADGGVWPACFREDSRSWACWGILPNSHGVVVITGVGVILWTTSHGGSVLPLHRARWGRLVVVSNAAAGSAVSVTARYPVPPPPGRLRGIRLATASVPGAQSTPIAPGYVWVTGDRIPPDAWLEVRTAAAGPVHLTLQDVADAPSSVPLHVTLPDRRIIEGRVVRADGEGAPSAMVSTFRLIEPAVGDPARAPPRRVLVAETITDDKGAFTIGDVGEGEHEIVAWHAQLGRASVPLPAGASDLLIHLRASSLARGRVLVRGQPARDVDVVSVPDATAFTAAQDITDVKGGDTRTGPDGRFVVMVAAAGGGELRIGGGTYAVTRVPLPRPAVPTLDLGDIELGGAIELTMVVDREMGCDARAAGPVGRTGLHLVTGRRAEDGSFRFALPEAGLWEFTLVCGGVERALSPAAVQIGPAQMNRELRFTVR